MSKRQHELTMKEWAKLPTTKAVLLRDGFAAFMVKGSAENDASMPTVERLKDLGFVAEEIGRLTGYSLLGEPFYVEIADTLVALRANEAALILVTSANTSEVLEHRT
jgi:Fe2+ transport system protein FeoA